jgi:hypothetical protein
LLCESEKYKKINILKKFLITISGNDSVEYLKFYLSSNEGKHLLNKINPTERTDIVENVKRVHQSAPRNKKSDVLSIVAGEYKARELSNMGFEFSNTQYYAARDKSSKTINIFDDKNNNTANSISDEIKIIIIDTLLLNSRESVKYVCHIDKWVEDILPFIPNFDMNKQYMMEHPRNHIYYDMVERYPEIKISLDKFYNLIPSNFKVPNKKTDMCPICEDGKKAVSELVTMNDSNSNVQDYENQVEQVQLYNHHLFFKDSQRNMYDESLSRTTQSSCVIVIDFKQNFKIGGGPIETSKTFYEKRQVSTLGMAIIFKDINNQQKIKYVNYFSEILTHDSLFVKECIGNLLSQNFMQQFQHFCFWSDCGLHFRSAELMSYVLKALPSEYINSTFIWNYFTEYHGKNLVDGHFGLLSKWFSDSESTQYITTPQELINVFIYKSSEHYIQLDIIFIIYERYEPRQNVEKLIIENFKSYLSFTHYNNDILASTISNLNFNTYNRVSFSTKIEVDKRITKYTPPIRKQKTGANNIMGTTSRQTLITRVNNTWDSTLPLQ